MLRSGNLVLIAALSLLLAACAPRQQQGDADMDALLWSTASAEYDVIARQIFFQAQRQLDRQLTRKGESAVLEQKAPFDKLPPAIIVDVDDTLLSNGALHYRLMTEGKSFDSAVWARWVNEARAKPIAGALEYVTHASKNGVTVFYLSNRDISLLEGTWRNLKQLGFPLEEDRHQLLLLNGSSDWGWDKSSRRAHVARQYRVLQVVGDGLGDFIGNTATMSLEEQRNASSRYLDYWGDKWFMLPNPVYGDWEKAILSGGSLPPVDPMGAKYRFMRGGESQGTW